MLEGGTRGANIGYEILLEGGTLEANIGYDSVGRRDMGSKQRI